MLCNIFLAQLFYKSIVIWVALCSRFELACELNYATLSVSCGEDVAKKLDSLNCTQILDGDTIDQFSTVVMIENDGG